jgi:hypothetical protein
MNADTAGSLVERVRGDGPVSVCVRACEKGTQPPGLDGPAPQPPATPDALTLSQETWHSFGKAKMVIRQGEPKLSPPYGLILPLQVFRLEERGCSPDRFHPPKFTSTRASKPFRHLTTNENTGETCDQGTPTPIFTSQLEVYATLTTNENTGETCDGTTRQPRKEAAKISPSYRWSLSPLPFQGISSPGRGEPFRPPNRSLSLQA